MSPSQITGRRLPSGLACAVLLGVLSSIGAGNLAWADSFVCPLSLDGRQTPPTAPAGWEALELDGDGSSAGGGVKAAMGAGGTMRNDGVEVYDGDPREQASLVPDDSQAVIGVAPVAWTMSDLGVKRPVFMACRYSGTGFRLARALPKGLRYCVLNNEFEDMHYQLDCR